MAKIAIRRFAYAATFATVMHGCGLGEEYYFFEATPSRTPPPNHSPQITLVFVAPLQTDVGYPITLSGEATDPDGDTMKVRWSAHTGTIANPRSADTTYTCRKPGTDTITFFVTDGHLERSMTVQVKCI